MKTLIGLFLLTFSTILYGQSKISNQLKLATVINLLQRDTAASLLVFDQTFDGSNYWISGGDPISIQKLSEEIWKVLDSTEKISKTDKVAIQAKFLKYVSKKAELPTKAISVDLISEEHQNLLANNMTVESSTSAEQLKAMRQRRIEIIKNNTPVGKQFIYQFSEPYYYNTYKNAILIYLIAEPGAYNFYVNTYGLIKGKWEKNKGYLFYNQPN